MLQIGYVVLYSQTVLNAEHYALFASLFVEANLLRSACKGKIIWLLVYKSLYGVKDEIGIFFWRIDVEMHQVGKRFSHV